MSFTAVQKIMFGGTALVSSSCLMFATATNVPHRRVIGHPGKSNIWKFYFKNYFPIVTRFWLRKWTAFLNGGETSISGISFGRLAVANKHESWALEIVFEIKFPGNFASMSDYSTMRDAPTKVTQSNEGSAIKPKQRSITTCKRVLPPGSHS